MALIETNSDVESLGEREAPPRQFFAELWGAFEAGKFVIDPQDSCWLPAWDSIVLANIILVAFITPYNVGFRIDCLHRDGFSVFDACVRLLFVCDLFLQFFVSFPHPINHRWVKIPKKIISGYLHECIFIDGLSVMPWGQVAKSMVRTYGENFRICYVLDLLGLLRVVRFSRLHLRYCTRLSAPLAWLKMAKLMVILSLSLHWIACGWGLILSIQRILRRNEGNTWGDALRAAKPGMFESDVEDQPWELYTASLYWSCMTVTSIGYGDVLACNTFEAWGAILAMAFSGLVWAHIIGSICALASALDEQNMAHDNQMDSLNQMMRSLQLPQDLRMRLREFFICRKTMFHRTRQKALLHDMSPQLQGTLARWVQHSVLKRVWFFQDVEDDAFIVGLFESFEYTMLPPRETIRLRNSMVCLVEGVAMKQCKLITKGDIWGVEELILSDPRLLENPTPLALSYVEMQYISRPSLDALLVAHPAAMRPIRKGVMWYALKKAVRRGLVMRLLIEYKGGKGDRRESLLAGPLVPANSETSNAISNDNKALMADLVVQVANLASSPGALTQAREALSPVVRSVALSAAASYSADDFYPSSARRPPICL